MSLCAIMESSLQQPQHSNNSAVVTTTTTTRTTPPSSSSFNTNRSSTSTLSSSSSSDYDRLLLQRVSNEIEQMRQYNISTPSNINSSSTTSQQQQDQQQSQSQQSQQQYYHSFPPACLEMLKNIKGNHRCIDCYEQNPQWAAYKYGVLVCLNCSGIHRSFGVQISCIRSISMDEWNINEIISMLEGGNNQLLSFFERHQLTEQTCTTQLVSNSSNNTSNTHNTNTSNTIITKDNVTRLRYKTKAALFYRTQMEQHVNNIVYAGPYRGREISRQITTTNTTNTNTLTNNNNNNNSNTNGDNNPNNNDNNNDKHSNNSHDNNIGSNIEPSLI